MKSVTESPIFLAFILQKHLIAPRKVNGHAREKERGRDQMLITAHTGRRFNTLMDFLVISDDAL